MGKLATVIYEDSMNNVLKKRIMAPIGVKDFRWRKKGRLANGIPVNGGGSGISISATDFARFGYLFLQNASAETDALQKGR